MMSKIAVVYWSGTGNTEAMANEVAEGAKSAGAEAEVFTPDTFSADKMDAYDAVAFGCPAMGAEELEDTEFEPMFKACEAKLSGKKIALLVWIRATGMLLRFASCAAASTILWETVFVNRIRRSGLPIFLRIGPFSFANTFALQPKPLQMSEY